LAAIRRRGCSGAAMTPCTYMVCRCDQDMYLPAADDESPVQKNQRRDRRARESAVSRNPGWLRLTWAGMMTLSGRYAEALTELGLKPGDRAGALGLRRRAPGFNSYDRGAMVRPGRDCLAREGRRPTGELPWDSDSRQESGRRSLKMESSLSHRYGGGRRPEPAGGRRQTGPSSRGRGSRSPPTSPFCGVQ
jgi:hypothetical protein